MKLAVALAAVLALVLPAVAAAAPPGATTGAASGVGTTTATVAGTVDPQGMTTTYHFEYGTSTAYGLQTGEADAGSGNDAAAASAALSGLTSSTTYHYRLVATNAAGIDRGSDRTFHTDAVAATGPPGASTGGVRSLQPTSATLGATVDPNGLATTYHFEYGTTTAYASRTPEVGAGSGTRRVAARAGIRGLAAGTRYHYRVVATNAAGVTRGRDRAFTTLRNPRGVAASAAPNPALWSGSTTVSGRVTGQGVAGVTVALERQDFPFGRPFYLVGTRRTARNGTFSFSVGPLWAMARLRVTTRTTIAAASSIVEVRNALRVGLHAQRLAGGRKRLAGSVNPAVPRGLASLQKRSPRGRWVTVRRAGVRPLRGNRSTYRFTVRRGGTYRVTVLPRDAFAHVRGASRTLTLRG
jgi:hypothetical protein